MNIWLWRKYTCGYPARYFSAGMQDVGADEMLIWPVIDGGQYPHLNRWEGLSESFIGFASFGFSEPHACVYDARSALSNLGEHALAKTWISGVDAAELFEFFIAHFLGVWLGEKTPYFLTTTPELEKII